MCPVPLFPPRPSTSDRFGWERVGLRRAPFGSDFGLRRAPFGSEPQGRRQSSRELSRVEPQGRRQSSRVRAPSRPSPVPSRPVPVPSRPSPVPSADAASTGPKSARRAGDPLLLLKKGSPPRRCPAGIPISSPAGILSPPASRAEIRWQNLPPFRAPLPTGCSAHLGPALRRGLDLGPALGRVFDLGPAGSAPPSPVIRDASSTRLSSTLRLDSTELATRLSSTLRLDSTELAEVRPEGSSPN